MRRTAVALAAVVLVMSTTAGCGSLQSSATEVGGERMTDDRPVRDGGTLTVALNADPDKLDPTLAQTLVGRTVFAGMCEKLYDVDERGEVVPQLATALPKVSADGRTVSFDVRKGAKFSDGTKLDADAVVTSLLRHRDLAGSARATELTPLKGAEATGPYSVRLTLKQAYVPLTAVLADRSGMVMSPAALKKYGKNFTNHPSCVGPFKYTERVGGDRIVLTKDANYYDADSVHLDKVIYKPIPDGSVRLANLRSGDLQVGDQMAPVDVKSALTDNKLQLFNSPSLGYQGIGINVGNVKGLGEKPGRIDTPMASDVRVREAFELAIDRGLINKVVFQGMYEPACGPISPESALAPGIKASECPKRDVTAAKRLLKQAGVDTPVPVELKISTTPEWSRIGQVIQAMAKDAGFAVTLRPTEYATMLEETDDGHYTAFNSGWSGRLDPDGNIASFLQTRGAMNAYGLSDKKIDALVERGRTEADPAERAEIYDELTHLTNDAHALIYLYRQKNYVVAGKDVAGVRVYGDGLVRVKNAGYAK
ncbi:ABC transporter substrate-binding protein [Streptomyces kunmingensis]|uniref:ABC transporter substrate-binding protein n=1 Tax=Streptomyces kunmingensis TaxID=68225 RepID=A0ABU6CHM2_9ACTN|nr:ABC transporter substrate-binding protein [Streptomyces kunmingensis]MEB3964203.1 ABC transporter substrate-binding protein [Streptomyces kunmingensis]